MAMCTIIFFIGLQLLFLVDFVWCVHQWWVTFGMNDFGPTYRHIHYIYTCAHQRGDCYFFCFWKEYLLRSLQVNPLTGNAVPSPWLLVRLWSAVRWCFLGHWEYHIMIPDSLGRAMSPNNRTAAKGFTFLFGLDRLNSALPLLKMDRPTKSWPNISQWPSQLCHCNCLIIHIIAIHCYCFLQAVLEQLSVLPWLLVVRIPVPGRHRPCGEADRHVGRGVPSRDQLFVTWHLENLETDLQRVAARLLMLWTRTRPW